MYRRHRCANDEVSHLSRYECAGKTRGHDQRHGLCLQHPSRNSAGCNWADAGLDEPIRVTPSPPIWQRTPAIVVRRSVASARRTAWSSQRVAAKMAMGCTADPERGCPAPTDDVGGRFNDRLDDARTRARAAVLRRPASSHASVDSGTSPRPTTESTRSTNGSGDKTPEGIRCLYGELLPTTHPSFGDGADIGRRARR